MTELDPEGYRAALARGAHLYDTRPDAARVRAPLDGAAPLSLAAVQAGDRPPLPADADIVLVCEYGRLSRLVGLYLQAEGFHAVASLRGGLVALRRASAG